MSLDWIVGDQPYVTWFSRTADVLFGEEYLYVYVNFSQMVIFFLFCSYNFSILITIFDVVEQ